MTLASEILADSPDGYWKIDEAAGTTFADSSGNGRDLTINHAPTSRSNAGPCGTSDNANRFGNTAFATAWAESASSNVWSFNGDTTLEVWVRCIAFTVGFQFPGLVAFGDPSSGSELGWLLYYDATGNTWDFKWTPSQDHAAVLPVFPDGASADPIVPGGSHSACFRQIVVVSDNAAAKFRIYVNGTLAFEQTPRPSALVTSTLKIGFNPDFADTEGDRLIADVAMYPTALSQSRIRAHYTAGSCSSCGTFAAAGWRIGAIASAAAQPGWSVGRVG